MSSITLSEIIDAILAGNADENLGAISGAIKDRKEAKARRLFHTVTVGTRARLQNLRPQYLIGVPVIVTKKNQTRIECKIDPDYLAKHGGAGRFDARPFTVKPDMLDLTA